MAANSGGKQRGPGRPFKKGQSGNPAGKPPGTRHRTTVAIEQLLDGEAEQLTRRCIELAKAGDTVAMRLCMERLSPAPKERRIELDLPHIRKATDVSLALASVTAAVATGEITPGEGNSLAALLEVHRRGIETATLEERIERLEGATKGTR